ncbi:MAG: hypothetical protein Q8941_04470 [Bacteroidota bacterium]|nr:hypothetical protein [Bacteroidota bacterium]
MLRNKTIVGIILVSSTVLFLLPGCYRDKTVIFDTGPEITRAVTFSNDIIPIFTKSCSLSGCHVTGGHVPDLSAANAYNSLKIGNYFNTADPVNSVIYLWLTGKKSTQMPPGGLNRDYNALVLAWIKQGANNN